MSQDQPQKKVTNQPQSQPEQPKSEPKQKVSATLEGYEVPAKEEGLFHVEMEPSAGRFNPDTGAKNHKAYVQKFHPRDFAVQLSMNDRGEPVYSTIGLRINKILHRPSAELLANVKVESIKDKQQVMIPMTEMLERIDSIIEKQPK